MIVIYVLVFKHQKHEKFCFRYINYLYNFKYIFFLFWKSNIFKNPFDIIIDFLKVYQGLQSDPLF